MIKDLTEPTRTPAKKINTGHKVIKANCPQCNKRVTARKSQHGYHCPNCNTTAQPLQGEREFTAAAGHFIFPTEVAETGIFPEGTTSIRIMPAYKTIDQTVPHSYTRWARNANTAPTDAKRSGTAHKQIFCTSTDGETAQRYDRTTGKKSPFPCSKDCSERKSGTCKPNATFYFRLVDADTLSIYCVTTASEQSIRNIITVLQQLSHFTTDGKIPTNAQCTLSIAMKESEQFSKQYQVLQLSPPPINLHQLKAGHISLPQLTSQHQPNHSSQGESPQSATTQNQGNTHKEDRQPAERIQKGRVMVKQKAGELIQGSNINNALEEYAKKTYGRPSYEDLTIEELLDLYRKLSKDPAVPAQIRQIATTAKQATS